MRAFIIFSVSISFAWSALAGIGTGGSNPPALQDSMEILLSNQALDGGLYKSELGTIGIITRKPLPPEAIITKNPILRTQSLRLSDSDFDILSTHKEPIEAVGELGGNLSLAVLPSDIDGAVILKDRRLIMRESLDAK